MVITCNNCPYALGWENKGQVMVRTSGLYANAPRGKARKASLVPVAFLTERKKEIPINLLTAVSRLPYNDRYRKMGMGKHLQPACRPIKRTTYLRRGPLSPDLRVFPG